MAKKPQNNAAMFGARSFKELLVASTKRGDILFALGIILMLVILILPMPAWLLASRAAPKRSAFSVWSACVLDWSQAAWVKAVPTGRPQPD